MNFKQYLAESAKQYKYKIKTVATLDDAAKKKIEFYLGKFNLIELTKFQNTMIQKNPMDFSPNIKNTAVSIASVELGLPISSHVLEREIGSMLGLPVGYLLVRGENDAVEIQSEEWNKELDIDAQAEKKELVDAPLLDVESQYPEAEHGADGKNYYGDAYNSKFLMNLRELSKVRVEATKVEPAQGIFSWLDWEKLDHEPMDDGEFNKTAAKTPDIDTKKALTVGTSGAVLDTNKTIQRTVVDKKNRKTTLTAKQPKKVN